MKTNHEGVANHIRQALHGCKEDAALEEVRRYLGAALRATESVSKKRQNRDKQSKYFAEEAKKKNDQWMEMLKNNLKLQMPEEIDDEQERID